VPTPQKNTLQVCKATLRWRVLRAVLAAMWLLRLVRLRHHSALVLRRFFESVHQMEQIKFAIRVLLRRLMRIQTLYRAFKTRKNQWCAHAGKAWLTVEDQYLAQSQHSEPAARRAEERIKWQQLRIPPPVRRQHLGVWYVSRIRQMLSASRCWFSLVEQSHMLNMDLRRYYALCGFTDVDEEPSTQDCQVSKAQYIQRPKALKVYLEINEEDILDIIETAARELRDTHPFQEHPAVRGNHKVVARGGRTTRRVVMMMRRSSGRRTSTRKPGDFSLVGSELEP